MESVTCFFPYDAILLGHKVSSDRNRCIRIYTYAYSLCSRTSCS